MLQRIRQTDFYASGGNLKLIYSIAIQLPLSAEVLSLPKSQAEFGINFGAAANTVAKF